MSLASSQPRIKTSYGLVPQVQGPLPPVCHQCRPLISTLLAPLSSLL